MQTITEGKATITVPINQTISKQLEVFYNPVMKINRELSISVINAWDKNDLCISDLFAASGIRSIRFLKELKKDIKRIIINDYDEKAIENIKKNLKQNNLEENDMIIIRQEEADLLLLKENGMDYIDIDPFGSPVPFLDAAAKRLSRNSILAITATDTSSLAGTYPNVCRRMYNARPRKGQSQHEIGIRILIRKCQVVAAQYDKALTPIFSYFKDHYYRICFKCEKGKKKVDEVMKQHNTIQIKRDTVGPLWVGKLWDTSFVDKMETNDEETTKFLNTIKAEMHIDQVLYHDLHEICSDLHVTVPKYAPLIHKIQDTGHKVARTHFTLDGIRSTISEEELKKLIK
jgi:tRNA (guanine26-N2/guanine27-N2)-dimethyltransferase